jgi:hypothetical protein
MEGTGAGMSVVHMVVNMKDELLVGPIPASLNKFV